ncbi:hypothetical protein EMIT043CA1_170038 [Pseudomonas brassicacearum]
MHAYTRPVVNQEPCGSELARDGGISVDFNAADPTLSRASSLPQGWCAKAFNRCFLSNKDLP